MADKGLAPVKLMRDVRDAGMDAWAKLMLRLTSSHEYQRIQGFVFKPALLAIAMFRKTSESTMGGVLGNLNMPSREEVLQISQRLTHIEMALDDLAAGLDQLRRSAGAGAGASKPQRSPTRDVPTETRPVSAKDA
jgi:uncharacterized membrane protein YjjP (DUF1212 family)